MAVQASPPMFSNNTLERVVMDGGVFLDGLNQSQSFQPQAQGMMMMGSFPPLPMASPAFASSSLNLARSVDPSDFLAALVEKQRQEMDQYLRLQFNRLRAALQQQWKQQLASLMTLECKASLLAKQKDGELAMAKQRAVELEEFLKRAEQERDAWQRIAKENEALALSLRNAVEQVSQPCFSSTGRAAAAAEEEEAQSCSGFFKEEAGIGRRRFWWPSGTEESFMLLLPCRHLCACQPFDEGVLEACPFCQSVVRSCTKVFLG